MRQRALPSTQFAEDLPLSPEMHCLPPQDTDQSLMSEAPPISRRQPSKMSISPQSWQTQWLLASEGFIRRTWPHFLFPRGAKFSSPASGTSIGTHFFDLPWNGRTLHCATSSTDTTNVQRTACINQTGTKNST